MKGKAAPAASSHLFMLHFLYCKRFKSQSPGHFAVSFSWRLDELLALLGAAVTILGARAPLGPIAEFTILFACLSIASHCLGGSTTFL